MSKGKVYLQSKPLYAMIEFLPCIGLNFALSGNRVQVSVP